MVEFALSITFLLFILVSIVYFGRYFLIAQVLLSAAQETAKVAARTPNLDDPATRDLVRGFSVNGAALGNTSLIYGALASARLLSQTIAGDMPPGSQVKILPWDATANDVIPPVGTVAVEIAYPFQLLGNPFQGAAAPMAIAFTADGSKPPFTFPNFTIKEQAVAAQEIYQP
jgi:hypothetical protein